MLVFKFRKLFFSTVLLFNNSFFATQEFSVFPPDDNKEKLPEEKRTLRDNVNSVFKAIFNNKGKAFGGLLSVGCIALISMFKRRPASSTSSGGRPGGMSGLGAPLPNGTVVQGAKPPAPSHSEQPSSGEGTLVLGARSLVPVSVAIGGAVAQGMLDFTKVDLTKDPNLYSYLEQIKDRAEINGLIASQESRNFREALNSNDLLAASNAWVKFKEQRDRIERLSFELDFIAGKLQKNPEYKALESFCGNVLYRVYLIKIDLNSLYDSNYQLLSKEIQKGRICLLPISSEQSPNGCVLSLGGATSTAEAVD